MKKGLSLALVAVLLGVASIAHAQLGVSYNGTTKTGLIDYSSVAFGNTRWNGQIERFAGDPDVYLNKIQIVGGTNFDSNLNFVVPETAMQVFDGSSSFFYQFGTPITGDVNWSVNNLVQHFQVSGDVAPGVYDFDVQFIGGSDANASDVINSQRLQIEVVPRLNVTATASIDKTKIGTGQGALVSTRVFNNDTARDFITSTWYAASGTGDPGFTGLQLDFRGDWFDKTISAGGSRTDEHSLWTALSTTPNGLYTSNLGVFGGLHTNDNFAIRASNVQLEVVPEPATMIALGAGVAMLARRRRRA